MFFVCISFSMNYKIDIGGKCYAIPTHLLPLRAKRARSSQTCEQFDAIYRPVRHFLYAGTDTRDVEQQER